MWAAINHLRREHAKPGSDEGGYLIDEHSGGVLVYVVGTQNSIEFEEETLNRCTSVCVLHSHPADSPANQYDWQWFMERSNVQRMIVVGPTHTYTLVKPANWQMLEEWRGSPFEAWEDYAVDIAFERGFSITLAPTVRQWQDIEEETNRRMANHYRLEFVVETFYENH